MVVDGGQPRSMLAADLDALLTPPDDDAIRLLGPFDPYLQLKDRETLVPDPGHRKSLWPALGCPGAIARGGELAGLWRPRASGRRARPRRSPRRGPALRGGPRRRRQRRPRRWPSTAASRLAGVAGGGLTGAVEQGRPAHH